MNRERAGKLVVIMQAYADGEEVQVQSPGCGWIDIDEPNFVLPPEAYRVKRDPREFTAKVIKLLGAPLPTPLERPAI